MPSRLWFTALIAVTTAALVAASAIHDPRGNAGSFSAALHRLEKVLHRADSVLNRGPIPSPVAAPRFAETNIASESINKKHKETNITIKSVLKMVTNKTKLAKAVPCQHQDVVKRYVDDHKRNTDKKAADCKLGIRRIRRFQALLSDFCAKMKANYVPEKTTTQLVRKAKSALKALDECHKNASGEKNNTHTGGGKQTHTAEVEHYDPRKGVPLSKIQIPGLKGKLITPKAKAIVERHPGQSTPNGLVKAFVVPTKMAENLGKNGSVRLVVPHYLMTPLAEGHQTRCPPGAKCVDSRDKPRAPARKFKSKAAPTPGSPGWSRVPGKTWRTPRYNKTRTSRPGRRARNQNKNLARVVGVGPSAGFGTFRFKAVEATTPTSELGAPTAPLSQEESSLLDDTSALRKLAEQDVNEDPVFADADSMLSALT